MNETTETDEDFAAFRALADGPAQNGHVASATHDSWRPVELAPILEGLRTGAIVGPVPTLLLRSDDVALLYRGEVHSFAGEPESGKSWVAAAECARLVALGAQVLYLDFEDTPASVIGRLLALGATPNAILNCFAYVRPDTPSHRDTVAQLATRPPLLAIIDGLSEAYGLLGLDLEKNADAAKFLALLPRPLASTGAAVVQIDHVTKSPESRGRYAIGAQHKLAGIAVAYSFEIIKPFSRLQAGTIKIRVEKDRHGHVRGHADGHVIALAQVEPHAGGERVTVTLSPPDRATGDGGELRPTVLMQRVAKFVEGSPGATRNDIRDLVDGNTAWKDKARLLLIAEGYIEVRPEGRAHRHYPLRPYDENPPRDHGTTTGPNGTTVPLEPHGTTGPTPSRGSRTQSRSQTTLTEPTGP